MIKKIFYTHTGLKTKSLTFIFKKCIESLSSIKKLIHLNEYRAKKKQKMILKILIFKLINSFFQLIKQFLENDFFKLINKF